MDNTVKKISIITGDEFYKNRIKELEGQVEYFEKLIPDSVVKLNQSLTNRVESLIEERGGLISQINSLKTKLEEEKTAHEQGKKVQAGIIKSARSDAQSIEYRRQNLENEVNRLKKKVTDLENERAEMQLKLESRDIEIQLLNEIKDAQRDDEIVSKIDRLTEMVESQSLEMVEAIKKCLKEELTSGVWSDVVDIIEKNKSYLIKSSAGKSIKKTNENLDRDLGICRDIISGIGAVALGEKWFASGKSPASRKSSASTKKSNLEKSGVLDLVRAFDNGDSVDANALSKDAKEMFEYLS